MMLKAGLRRNVPRPALPLRLPVRSRRFVTNLPPSTPTPTPPSSRLARYIPRLSDISTKSGLPLPSLAISFAILHELTAILPLLALFFAFQAFGVGGTIIKWASRQEDGDDLGLGSYIREWLEEGQKRVDKVARRYGLFGYERGSKVVAEEDRMSSEQEALQVAAAAKQSSAAAGVASAVAAYVVVKAILPLRIAASIGFAPGFTRYALEPFRRGIWHGLLRRPRPTVVTKGKDTIV
ncbi:hypothetical protein FFLO_01487 [Filobasidium floriforme]|uniref:Uncharacterized protein n=1 Tax=Filobasidium floriforme TaxID=5210 RepID=A0A8K0JPG5_9TREE|nr:uncharacterized protein HD553DRAFT_98190 [Filobasidium floriforme]KAG7563055.1 hypothetical protein FFLO_01487 [Filobasidium floriforme]KAH8089608.1 hypothetical protein HD553DRAFT_98190 [Filobasidium floriforme]